MGEGKLLNIRIFQYCHNRLHPVQYLIALGQAAN